MEKNLNSSAPWVPFKIPPVVERDSPSDNYILSFSSSADSYPNSTETNPTKFLEWKKTVPDGTSDGQFSYWSGNEWIVLTPKIVDICEDGEPKQYKIPMLEVV